MRWEEGIAPLHEYLSNDNERDCANNTSKMISFEARDFFLMLFCSSIGR